MKLSVKNLLAEFFCLSLCFSACLSSCSSEPLSSEGWEAENCQKLNELILSEGKSSTDYSEDRKPYAVFDFDYTSIINDVEVSLLTYQLENLRFKLKPLEIYAALTDCLDGLDFEVESDVDEESKNQCRAADVVADIVSDYSVLYDSYIGKFTDPKSPEATDAFDAVKESAEYLDFRAKTFALYQTVEEYSSYEVSLLWILKLLDGFTYDEITALTKESCAYFTAMGKLSDVVWESPEMGRCGRLSSKHKEGIVVTAAMRNLYNALKSNGFDVYICSASLETVVEAMACDPAYGFNMDADHVFGLRMNLREDGLFKAEYADGYVRTFQEGKTECIKTFFAPEHGGAAPSLIAGDSNGDYNMLTDFEDLKYGLILNVGRTGKIAELIASGDPKYLIHCNQ